MYQIIDAAKKNVQEYTLSGTIDGVAFSGEENIVIGSCSYQNQCSDTSNFNLGYVYTGVFSATFINLDINRNDWSGLEIVPVIEIDGISVPIGHFFISEANHTAGIVAVKAKDAMEKFKKSASISVGSSGTPYDFLSLACQECGVAFGMTQAEVSELPNGNLPLVLSELGDIEDWIDVLYWVSQQLGGFATINRNGELVIRTYHNEVDDTMPADVRFNSRYGDEIIEYTGLQVVNTAEQTTEYYHAEVDDGYNVKLGSNPFMQISKAQREIYCANLIEALGEISYNSCEVSIPFGFQYDLGDVLKFPGGDGDENNLFCVMYISFVFGGECKIKSIPKPSKSMSKADKNIQGLLSTVNKNEYQDYEIKNTGRVLIGDGEEKRIVSVKLASNNSTKAMIHIQILLESKANDFVDTVPLDIEVNQEEPEEGDEEGEITASGTVSGDDIFRLISEKTTKGAVRYIVQSEEVSLKPQEEWIDGNHILHLMYIQPLEAGIPLQFDVYLKAKDGDIVIPRGGIWFYGSGRGLVGDGKWDGTLNIQEAAAEFNLNEITFEQAIEGLIIDNPTLIPITASDTAQEFTLQELTFENAADLVFVNLYVGKFDLITEAGETFTTEDGIALVTEHD